MRWLALLALGAALALAGGTERAAAQTTAPGPPTIDAAAATTNTLTVTWSAPLDDGGAAISAYDLRYIESAATDKADSNWTLLDEEVWTSGSLSYVVSGLRDSTGYDVQVRAVNATGDGDWSATSTGTTNDYGGTTSTATALVVSASTPAVAAGRIDSETDKDFFSFVLSEDSEIVVRSTGPVDVVGEVLDHAGISEGSNNDSGFPDNPWNFIVPGYLAAGTYYASVAGNAGATGPYEIHVEILPADIGNSLPSAAAAYPGLVTAGRIGRPGDTQSYDADYYKLEFSSPTDFYVVAFSETFVNAKLLDASGNTIATSFVFHLEDDLFGHQTFGGLHIALGFMLRGTGAAGTYYIKVEGTQSYFTGGYVLQVGEAPNPGNSLGTATPIPPGAGAPGRISSSSDADYFSISFDEDTHASVAAVTVEYEETDLEITAYDDQNTRLDFYTINHERWDSYARDYIAGYAFGLFEAGRTYRLRVRGNGGATGAYLLLVQPEGAYDSFFKRCRDLTTDDAIDTFYGCQWHLNNTGQFSGGAMQDINVEEVWEEGTTGADVNIAIVDDGLFYRHEDLKDNVDTSRNYDYWSLEYDYPADVYQPFFVNHGTAVAGLIAAEHNEVGVRGVAPGATIYSYNYVDYAAYEGEDLRYEADAMTRNRVTTQISSNSWGPSDDGLPHPSPSVSRAAIETGLRQGDGGRGISYIWAAGNGGDTSGANDNSNLDGYANFYGVTAVCAVNYNDVKSIYSEPGANLWVCAPSNGVSQPGITTTAEGATLHFFGNGSDFRPGFYRDNFGGTSAAAPIVSGVVALMRSANPNLTWRDVKLILAASARKNHAGDGGWEQGALRYGSDTDSYSFNHKYGFGVVDAGAAVALANAWTNVPTMRSSEATWDGLDVAIDTLHTPYTRSVTFPDSDVDFIEFVEITINLDHSSIRDLKIELESPSGATSLLVHSGVVRDFYSGRPYREPHWGSIRFGSAKHLGESPDGEWKLHITDEAADEGGTLRDFRLKVYGHSQKPGFLATPSGTTVGGSLAVSWTVPGNTGTSPITSYDVRYIRSDAADKADSNWTEVTSAWTSGTLSYDLTGLTPAVRYDVQVRAVNSSGGGPWSETVVGSVAAAPGVPTNIVVTDSDEGLVVAWEPPASDGGADIQRYDIRRIRSDASDKADDNWIVSTGAWRSGDVHTRASVTNLTNGVQYDVQVRAANSAGDGPWSATSTGTPAPVNVDSVFPATESGVRSIGEHQASPNIGEPVGAVDPDDNSLTYTLTGVSDDILDIDPSTGQLFRKTALDYETTDQYRVTVHVSDNRHRSGVPDPAVDDSVDVVIDVLDENDPPSIQGRESFTVTENVEGKVEEYVGMDREGDQMTIAFVGPDIGLFSHGDDGDIDNGEEEDGELRFVTPPDFENPTDSDRDNVYEVLVSISDGIRSSRELMVKITVTDQEEPPIVTGPTDLDFPEDSVGTVGTYVGVDPEKPEDPVEFDVGGDDGELFKINESGQLTFKQRPNYEDVDDHNEDDVYEVSVLASDAFGSGSLDVLVRPTDADEAPEIDGPAHVTIEENGTVFIGSYTQTDPEGQPSAWETLAGPDAAAFEFDDTSGELRFVNVPDYDARADVGRDNTYDVTLRASDQNYTGTFAVKVTVTDVDEAPIITGDSMIEFAENDTGTLGSYSASDPERGTVIVSLAGPDAGDFSLTNGVLGFANIPDFETAADTNRDNEYQVTIEAADVENTATFGVTVTVTNEDEAGTLTLSSEQPQVGTALTATLTDLDGRISGESWSWQRLDGGTWTPIGGATGRQYTPVDDDLNRRLRVTVEYTDGHGPNKGEEETTDHQTQPAPPANHPPEFESSMMERSVDENSGKDTAVGARVRATDDDNDVLAYTLSGTDGGSFTIDGSSGQIRVAASVMIDHETRDSYSVVVTATDPSDDSDSTTVTIAITDVDEPPVAKNDEVATVEDVATTIDVLRNDEDPEDKTLTVSPGSGPRSGTAVLNADSTFTYTPNPDTNGIDSFTYTISDGRNPRAGATVHVSVESVNDSPSFDAQTAERVVAETDRNGDPVGAPVTASDVDHEPLELSYSLRGTGAPFFRIARHTGQILVAGMVLDAAAQPEHLVTVVARDPGGGEATIDVTIEVSATPVTPPVTVTVIGGGGGGGPSGPTPSEIEFEWNVTRDIEELDGGHDVPTGSWSDGTTLWLAENGDGAADAVYAYDLASGERVQELEFELDDANLAPRGVWSDRTTIWISDSGKEKLFAHDLASGERLPDSDLALHPDNDDPRGIWSGGSTLWVLDGRDNALFGYDLESGELLAEYGLDSDNDDPHGIWSDGTSVWVSDHNDKRLFAYRLPSLEEEDTSADEEEDLELERVRDEEFWKLPRVSNNSPRGLWSDGDVMYVADESDGRVYTYNMPDAIDARLVSLALSDVEIGEFSRSQAEYEGVAADGATQTTVEARPAQSRARVVIDPLDADEVADGHQVALDGLEEITVTVTSPDESRMRVYRVRIGGAAEQLAAPACLSGSIAVGFSLVISAAGSVEDLVACAQSRHVTTLYTLHDGGYLPYILGAPEFVNRSFRELYADGLPSFTPLIAKNEGSPSPAPASDDVPEFGPDCLSGEIAVGFSLVLYEGGSVKDLEACAQSHDVTVVYALHEGEYVPYILGAPEFVNRSFRELFASGVPAATPFITKSEGQAGGDGGDASDN